MSTPQPLPWIHDYLIGLAKQYGTDYFNAPPCAKPKTVQILELLHFGKEGQESNVWARVSDSRHIAIVKFTPNAAVEYYNTKKIRITQHQTAVIRMKSFKAIFTRVPLGGEMSPEQYPALECESATPRGSFGEARIGKPRDISTDPEIKAWADGLKKGGGAGNIFKKREEQGEKEQVDVAEDRQTFIAEQQKVAIVPQQSTKEVNRPTSEAIHTTYKQTWKKYKREPSLLYIPADIMATLKALPVECETKIPLPSLGLKRGNSNQTASHDQQWIDSDEHSDTDSSSAKQDDRSSEPISDWPSSGEDPHPPAPAQRKVATPQSSREVGPEKERSLKASARSPLQNMMFSSPTEPLPPSYSEIEAPASSSRLMNVSPRASQHVQTRVMRKVPRPEQPREWIRSSGPERILVPASDTSMSQSQSQSQSQRDATDYRRAMNAGASSGTLPQEENTGPRSQKDKIYPLHQTEQTEELPEGQGSKTRRFRQVARKSTTKRNVRNDPKETVAYEDEEISEDSSEATDHRHFENINGTASSLEKARIKTYEIPPSKAIAIIERGASPNGEDGVTRTLVQHDPVAWNRPSFMKRQRKLGGFSIKLSRLREDEGGNKPWISWQDIDRMYIQST